MARACPSPYGNSPVGAVCQRVYGVSGPGGSSYRGYAGHALTFSDAVGAL